ncbi:MAG: glutamate synthase subunit beta [bacterium]
MGKINGFIEHSRKTAPYRPVNERVKDYKSVNTYLSDDEIAVQASRCMNCGIPYCHCTGCPVFNLIPEWNDLVYKGKWKEALKRLEKTNTLPEITGRICPAPCETSCTLSINDGPVTIKQIELAIIEHGFNQGWIKPIVPHKEIHKKIAVIGSGPASLAAAQSLRSLGYNVTVFEKSDKIGGILRYGIPDFKLEKWVLDRRIKLMKESGIKFETDVNIGKDISYRYLKKTFKSTLVSIGAGYPRDLAVPGRELDGIYFAMDYLSRSNSYVSGNNLKEDIISAKGKQVLVIGGGDTGSDCIGTAIRQGAKKIYQFEIMPSPPEWQQTWNPSWPEWPTILRTTSSHEEGVDRDWSILVKKFIGKNNAVKEAVCSKIEWKNSVKDNCLEITEIPDSDFTLKIDLVLLAMGFMHVEHNPLLKDIGVEYNQQGNINTDENYATNIKGVFAAGDAAIGASLVVRAVYQGQQAAKAIHAYLTK